MCFLLVLERERGINRLPLKHTPTGTRTQTQVCTLTGDQALKLFGGRDDAPTKGATQPGKSEGSFPTGGHHQRKLPLKNPQHTNELKIEPGSFTS